MANIKNMNQLREAVLKAFDDLRDGKITISEAATISKLSETVISGLKSEMQYALLTQQQPYIPFYGEQTGKFLDKKEVMRLT